MIDFSQFDSLIIIKIVLNKKKTDRPNNVFVT